MASFGFNADTIITLLLGFVAGVGIPLLLYYLQRKKATRILCKQIELTSLVDIKDVVKRRISVHFDQNEVHNLSQTTIKLVNIGQEPISPVKIRIRTNDDSTVLEALGTTRPESKELSIITQRSMAALLKNEVVLEMPYLNPLTPHGEEVVVDLIVDGSTEELAIDGGDKGWSIAYESLEAQRQKTRKQTIPLLLIVTPLVLWGLVALVQNLILLSSDPPTVESIITSSGNYEINVGESVAVVAETTGVDLNFKWSVERGSINTPEGDAIVYTAPALPGPDILVVEVSDKAGRAFTRTVTFNVVAPVSTPESSP